MRGVQSYPTLAKRGFMLTGRPDTQAVYQGADDHGPRFGGWNPPDYGPNLASCLSRPKLRSRSRQQCRDNPLATSAREQYVTNVVGTGFRPKLIGIDPGVEREIKAAWRIACTELDAEGQLSFDGMIALAVSCMFESGETLGRRIFEPPGSGLSTPVTVQLLEPDHLDHFRSDLPGDSVRDGIQFAGGRRVSYRMLKRHPGETDEMPTGDTADVPADDVLHMFRKTRPGQRRGIPHLHAALTRLYQLDMYQDAELERKKQAAQMVGFISSQLGDIDPNQVFPTNAPQETWVDARNQFYSAVNKLKTGTWNVLAPGDKTEFNQASDVGGNYEVFLRKVQQEIAASAGITYEQMTGDMRGVNYSSARVRLIDIRRSFEMIQMQIVCHQFCRRVWQWWLTSLIASRSIVVPDFERLRAAYLNPMWIPDPFDSVDLLKETMRDLAETRAGFTSLPHQQAKRGHHPDDLLTEQQESNRRLDDAGMVFDSDPRRTSGSGTMQALANAEAAGQNTNEETQ